ncbi:glycosyltransferase family 2 protein [Kineococcus sp. SYSU DK003]|uniref:glycosyltransferase family 2 protein n=1 Tax=Kineococcus sp. SYSU DK003 TaxID=3383124 RepID=UPI003D7E9D87
MSVDVSIVVVTYNAPEWIAQCFDSLTGEARPQASFEIIAFDNASDQETKNLLAERARTTPELRVHYSPDNLGFAVGVNRAVEMATGQHVLLMNPDAMVRPGAVDALLAFLKADPGRGIVGGRVLYPDGTVSLTSCFAEPSLWSWFCYATGLSTVFKRNPVFDPESLGRWDRDSVREVDIISGAFLMTSRRTWRELGGFDEKFFMYGEDADLNRRAADAGFRPAITPEAVVVHAGGKSSVTKTAKQRLLLRGKAEYARKHWSPARAGIGIGMLAAGVGLRTVGELVLRRGSIWRPLWRERTDWGKGWPTPEQPRGARTPVA